MSGADSIGSRFMDEDTLRTGIRRTAWKWTRSMAWRSLKQLGHTDPEFCLYQRLCLENLVPRLRSAGYTSEAPLLSCFETGLARLTHPQIHKPA